MYQNIQSTGLLIIKPLSITRGLAPRILSAIVADGWIIDTLQDRHMCATTTYTLIHASQPGQALNLVLSYYDSFTIGPSIIMTVSHRKADQNTLTHLNTFVGKNPVSILNPPHTLRYQFGGHQWRGVDCPDWDDGVHSSLTPEQYAFERRLLVP